jgi:hypothetical protein
MLHFGYSIADFIQQLSGEKEENSLDFLLTDLLQ